MAEKKTNNDGGFFHNFIMNLFNGSSPEAEKKRKLKAIAKDLSKTKFHNFYKPTSSEMLVPFAKFLYEVYKVISPAQLMFKTTNNTPIFNRQIISFCLSDKQLELLETLSEENIVEKSKKMDFAVLKQAVESNLEQFSSTFDAEKITVIENLNTAFWTFRDFCCFDYYFALKKFSSSLTEHTFSSTPNFENVNAEYLLDELKDFIAVAYEITGDINWAPLFDFLKMSQKNEFVSVNVWKKITARMKAIQMSNAMDMIIQLISKDPKYQTKVEINVKPIAENFLDKLHEETKATLDKIQSEQKSNKTASFSQAIFGGVINQYIRYYTEGMNNVLSKKELNTFEYTEPLNLLKQFILEFVKRDIHEYYDVVVVRGQWDSTLAAPFSNCYQELLKISDEITSFDEELDEMGPIGSKIKTLLPKTAHDPGAESIINRLVNDANEQAKSFMLTCTHDFVTIGKTMKQLIEDYARPKHVIVQNWKELEKFIETPMKDFSVGIYKKLYLFVQLMQTYLSNE